MFEHPQVIVFRQAADLLRDERYWARNADEELEFLRTFMRLLVGRNSWPLTLREVAYHLDAMQALDSAGLAAYEHAAAPNSCIGHGCAELLLMTVLDSAIDRFLATCTTARNTGVRRIVPDGRIMPSEI